MVHVKFSLLAVSLMVLLQNRGALSHEDKEKFMGIVNPIIEACDKEFGVDPKAPVEFGKINTSNPLKCRFACVFKKMGIFNGDGKYDKDKAISMFKEIMTDAEDTEGWKKAAEACETVNSEDVSDGDEGCDRSMLLISCMVEYSNTFFMHPMEHHQET